MFKSIVDPVTESASTGYSWSATNPVDIATRITDALSGFNPESAGKRDRFGYRQAAAIPWENLFSVDPRNVHAYVMGNTGTEFVLMDAAMIATKPILSLCEEQEKGGREVIWG